MLRVSGATAMASTMMRGFLSLRLGWVRPLSFCCCNSSCRSRTSWVSEETTAMWVSGLALEPRKILPKTKPARMTGIIMVVMRKPRVRMRSTYSRRAISQTLSILVDPFHFIFIEQFNGEIHFDPGGAGLLDLFDE